MSSPRGAPPSPNPIRAAGTLPARLSVSVAVTSTSTGRGRVTTQPRHLGQAPVDATGRPVGRRGRGTAAGALLPTISSRHRRRVRRQPQDDSAPPFGNDTKGGNYGHDQDVRLRGRAQPEAARALHGG